MKNVSFRFFCDDSYKLKMNKGLRRAQHYTTAACRPWKFEQVYFQVNVDALKSLTL